MAGRGSGPALVGLVAFLGFSSSLPLPTRAEEHGWRLEVALGAAHSFGSTLGVALPNGPALELEAEWSNNNFESPLYYALRVARVDSRGTWALRLVHLKVFLANPPPEVERFSVSHGYNLLTLERSLPLGGFDLAAGLGVVVAHPEATLHLPTAADGAGGAGYSVTGPTGALALARRIPLGKRLALVPEIRFTLSRAHVQLGPGEAAVPNASVHVLVGLEVEP